ncbi:MAG: hypothetical protein JJU36_02610 [Phycisphaeraceae bacterium]|nr:hypothetical protein [Phycisphaeraceae bacterium]
MPLYAYADYPLPDLNAGDLIASLPIDEAVDGPLYDRVAPCDHNDRIFKDWDAPLVWHHQPSQVKVSRFFKGIPAVHFAFGDRIPEVVWQKNWTLWYDHALVTRQPITPDCLLTGTFALEEVATGMGSDNVERIAPWAGIVARMQDLRRYYFLTLEYPGRVVLYRRDDHQWTEVAWAQVNLDVFTAYRLTLQCRGSQFRTWIDEHFLFAATDYGYPNGGYAGMRATCVAFATDFSIRKLADAPAMAEPAIARGDPPADESLPTPVIVADLDLTHLGPLSKTPRHNASQKLVRVIPGDGKPQLLVKCFGHPEGATHALVGLDGRTVWLADWPAGDMVHALPPREDGTHDLIVIGKEMMLVDGATGRVARTAPLPEVPEKGRIAPGNGPKTLADLDGDGVVDTYFLTCGADSPHLWAVDLDMNVRWYVRTPSGQGHGRHLAVCDTDGDGRDEIIAGCCTIGADGRIRWVQDEVLRRLGCPNGGHVDSTQAGYFAGPNQPPTAHYQGSSAGHIVLDARDGTLLAVHPQGHAQSGHAGRIVPDYDGVAVSSSNRWGSYGVTAIYDAVGNRLGRFQPGFTSQGAKPINWAGLDYEHLLVCDGQGYRGIYDHLGRRLLDLEPWMPYTAGAFSQRYDRINTLNAPISHPACDDLLIRMGNRIRVLGAKRPLPARGSRKFRPQRRGNVSWPAWLETA